MADPDARTRLVGIIGDPVAHSLSPRMHNAAFAAVGLNWVYLAFRVPAGRLAAALRGLAALGAVGVNVTVPHKEAVLPLLDAVEPAAARVGAVNVICLDGERLRGDNTDAGGLIDALAAQGVVLRGSRALILGAGGGGRAAAVALAEAGAARLVILNRTVERAQALAAHVARLAPGCALESGPLEPAAAVRATAEADVVVQATSAPLSADPDRAGWLDAMRAGLRPGMTVLDMVYTPRWTPLLAAARAAGATAVSGLAMLVHQGARAFALWTGRPAPLDVMWRAVDAEVPHRG
jgi:shikimate dehydrogenase